MSYLRMHFLMISMRLVQRKGLGCMVVSMVAILIRIPSCVIVQNDWLCRSDFQPARSWIFMVAVSADMLQAIQRLSLTVSLLAVTCLAVVLVLCQPILQVMRPMVRLEVAQVLFCTQASSLSMYLAEVRVLSHTRMEIPLLISLTSPA